MPVQSGLRIPDGLSEKPRFLVDLTDSCPLLFLGGFYSLLIVRSYVLLASVVLGN
jgi:hypothetical protein